MADPEWVKNLLESELSDGHWQPSNINKLKRTIREKIDLTFQLIRRELGEMIKIYDESPMSSIPIKLMPMGASDRGLTKGLIILAGPFQMDIIFDDEEIAAHLAKVSEYDRKVIKARVFSPRYDSFGSIAWHADTGMLMNSEMVVQILFEDLIRSIKESLGHSS